MKTLILLGVLVAVLVLFLLPVASTAQSPEMVTDFQVRFYRGDESPVRFTFAFGVEDVACGLPQPIVPAEVINPTLFVWDEIGGTGLTCQLDTTIAGLFSLPPGSYEATITAVNAVGESAESDRSNPFSIVDLPAVLTGFVVIAPPPQ